MSVSKAILKTAKRAKWSAGKLRKAVAELSPLKAPLIAAYHVIDETLVRHFIGNRTVNAARKGIQFAVHLPRYMSDAATDLERLAKYVERESNR